MTAHRTAAEVVAGLDLRGRTILVTGVSSGLGAESARVESSSSRGHLLAGVDLDDPDCERAPYDAWQAYGRPESGNVLLAVEVDRRLSARGVRANAVHPDGIVTELGRHLTPEMRSAMTARFAARGPIQFKQDPHGAATQVWAAVSPELEGVGGRYLEDVRIADPSGGENDPFGFAAHAIFPAIAAQLWSLSERLVAQKFEL